MNAGDFMPHGMCYLWRPDVLTLHVASDGLIGLSYLTIPFSLLYFVRRRADLEHHFLFLCFAVFIVSCGATHLLEIWTIWRPDYWLSGTVKAITAFASAATAVLLVRTIPVALRIPGPAELRSANAQLQAEVSERQRAEHELSRMNEKLEALVVQRTAALEAANNLLTAQAEQRARAEALLRALINQVPISLAMFDRELNHLVASGRWLDDVIGGHADPLGRTLSAVLPEMSNSWKSLPERALRGETARLSDDRWVGSDGTTRWYDWAAQPWSDGRGETRGVIMYGVDITERKAAEQRARTVDAGFRTLADNLPQIIWTADASGAYDFVSRQWEVYTGTPCAAGLGDRWLELVHPDDRDDLRHRLADPDMAGRVKSIEFRLRRQDGEYRWFALRRAALLDESGNVQRWCGSSTDIQEQKQISDARMRVQKMEALGTLAGGIAHDFNNIISAIAGNAALAAEELAPEHPARLSIQEIERASRRAADIVRRILSFSRQETLELAAVRLNDVVSEALRLLRPTLPATIEVSLQYDDQILTAMANATQIHQVVVNLTTNAVHAIGSRHGHVRLEVHAATIEDGQATPLLAAGRYVCLSVEDDGQGMDRETMGRIFDPFFTTKATGTGLGLSVVDGIMKAHGGAVTVHSELGRGTIFRLYFPLLDTSATVDSAPNPRLPADAARCHILYVDDDPALVSMTSRRMLRLGYQVTAKMDPRAALELFEADPTKYDVVVTDLSMPKMSGFDLAQAIKSLRPDIPIFMTSGYFTDEDQARAAAMGITKLLEKPGTIEHLCRELENVSDGGSQQPRSR